MITKEELDRIHFRGNLEYYYELAIELLKERDDLKKENEFLMKQTKSTVSFMNQQAFLDSEIDKIKKERDEALRRGDACRETLQRIGNISPKDSAVYQYVKQALEREAKSPEVKK